MSQTEKIRAVFVALLSCLAIALLAVSVVQRNNLTRDVDKRLRVEAEAAALFARMEERARRPVAQEAVVESTPPEESEFLNFVRQSARSCDVRLVRWSAKIEPFAGPDKKEAEDPALKDVTSLSGSLSVIGPYRKVLAFAHRLSTGPRLVNLSDITWSRPETAEDSTQLTATVTRYVVPPTATISSVQP